MFLGDILVTFRTTYYDTDNELVLDKSAIRKNYMKRWAMPALWLCARAALRDRTSAPAALLRAWPWIPFTSKFAIDCMATIPFELIGLLIRGTDYDTWPAGKLIIRLKLLRLLRASKPMRKLDVHNNLLRVAEMLGIFIVYAHIVGARRIPRALGPHAPVRAPVARSPCSDTDRRPRAAQARCGGRWA